MGQGTLEEVRNGSGDPQGGLGWFLRLSRRFGMGRGPLGGPELYVQPSGQSETGQETLGEVLDSFLHPQDVRDGSGDLGEVWEGPGDLGEVRGG